MKNDQNAMNKGLLLHVVLQDIGKGACPLCCFPCKLHAQSGVDDINYSLLITQHCNFAESAPAASSQHSTRSSFSSFEQLQGRGREVILKCKASIVLRKRITNSASEATKKM